MKLEIYKNWIINYKLNKKKNILNHKIIKIEYIAKKKDGLLIEEGLFFNQKRILLNLKEKIDLFEREF